MDDPPKSDPSHEARNINGETNHPTSDSTTADDRTIRHRNTRSNVVHVHNAPTTLAISTGTQHIGHPIRRIRHAEVVLVDQVSIRFGRYWFRLRWPGPRGGVAGFIALGLVPNTEKVQDNITASFHLRDERILKLVRSSSNEMLNPGTMHMYFIYNFNSSIALNT